MRGRHLAIVEGVVPVLVGAVIVVGELLTGVHGSKLVLAAALGIGAAGALGGRKRWPFATLAASTALVAVLFHIDRAAGVAAMLAPAVGLYSLALTRGRRAQLLAGTCAVAAVVAADAMHGGNPTVLQTLGHVLLVTIPLLGAEAIRGHRSYMEVLQERVALAAHAHEQEARQRLQQERLRIARELHDVVAHTLTEVNVQAAAAAERLDPGPGRDALERIEESSHRAIGELRAVLGVLRDPDGSEAPRVPAPGLADLPELVGRARETGLTLDIHARGTPPARLSDASSLAAYRIIQESLTNARRHAPGEPVQLTLSFEPDMMSILVENPLDAGARSASIGIGIKGMCERAASVGGSLLSGPTANGFTVRAELPYQPAP